MLILFYLHVPWFGQHDVVDAGVLIGQCPWEEVAKILEHVLGEEGSVGSHHSSHRVENGEESLERLHALGHTLLTLRVEGERERERESQT
jgi:hypothetical protein